MGCYNDKSCQIPEKNFEWGTYSNVFKIWLRFDEKFDNKLIAV